MAAVVKRCAAQSAAGKGRCSELERYMTNCIKVRRDGVVTQSADELPSQPMRTEHKVSLSSVYVCARRLRVRMRRQPLHTCI